MPSNDKTKNSTQQPLSEFEVALYGLLLVLLDDLGKQRASNGNVPYTVSNVVGQLILRSLRAGLDIGEVKGYLKEKGCSLAKMLPSEPTIRRQQLAHPTD